MRRGLLVAVSALLVGCQVSTEVTVLDSITTTSARPTTTDALATTTSTPATTTTQAPTTTTQQTTTTSPTTTTTRAPTTPTTRAPTTTLAPTTTVATTTTAPPASATVTITASNFAFSPASVTINRGDTVQWVLGSGSHTTTSGISPNPDGGWNQQITAPVSIVFSRPGQFSYFCQIHPEMQGTITVP